MRPLRRMAMKNIAQTDSNSNSAELR